MSTTTETLIPLQALKTTNGRPITRLGWSMEVTLAIAGRDDPSEARSFPFLVVGMAVMHKPGHSVGEQATESLTSIHSRGHPAGWLGGDRADSNAQPEKLQLPALAFGYRLGVRLPG